MTEANVTTAAARFAEVRSTVERLEAEAFEATKRATDAEEAKRQARRDGATPARVRELRRQAGEAREEAADLADDLVEARERLTAAEREAAEESLATARAKVAPLEAEAEAAVRSLPGAFAPAIEAAREAQAAVDRAREARLAVGGTVGIRPAEAVDLAVAAALLRAGLLTLLIEHQEVIRRSDPVAVEEKQARLKAEREAAELAAQAHFNGLPHIQNEVRLQLERMKRLKWEQEQAFPGTPSKIAGGRAYINSLVSRLSQGDRAKLLSKYPEAA